MTLAALDAQGNPVTQYTGPDHFSGSDRSSGAVLPPDGTLSRGAGTFSVTLATVGAQTITVTDAANSITKTVTVNVGPGPAAALTLVTPASATVNQPFNVTVNVKDSFGNVATGYTGTLHFSTSDISPLAKLPANYPFTAADAGTHVFSVTLQTPPSQTITVTDVANSDISTTSASIAVNLPLP